MMKKIISLLCLLAFLPTCAAYAASGISVYDMGNIDDGESPTDKPDKDPNPTPDPDPDPDPEEPEPEPEEPEEPVVPVTPDNLITAPTTRFESATEAQTFNSIIVDKYDDYEADNTPLPVGNGNLYIDAVAAELNKALTLNTVVDITASGRLFIADGRTLTFAAFPDTTGPAYNLSFGSIDLDGKLYARGTGNFTVTGLTDVAQKGIMDLIAQKINLGQTNIAGIMTLAAPDITLGATTVDADAVLNAISGVELFTGASTTDVFGTMNVSAQGVHMIDKITVENGATLNLTATGATTSGDAQTHADEISMVIKSLENSGYTKLDSATIMATGNISNNVGGDMDIIVTDSMTVMGGSISNAGTMDFTGGGTLNLPTGNISNSGTGEMNMTLGSLTAATIKLSGASKFDAVISGETNITTGFDLSGMASTGTFNLETDTLNQWRVVNGHGNDNDLDNNLDLFKLIVKSGDLAFGDIGNAATVLLAEPNTKATLELSAQNITATSIMNYGKSVTINATNDITLTNNIQNYAGDITIGAQGKLTAGDVSNYGGNNIILDGKTSLTLGAVTAHSGDTILSSATPGGTITINGGVVNGDNGGTIGGGDIGISAADLMIIGGITHYANAGNTTVTGTGKMNISSVNIGGGKLTVNGPREGENNTGNVSVVGSFGTSGNGQIDLGGTVKSVVAGTSINIAGNLLGGGATADGAGNVNVAGTTFELSSGAGDITIGQDISLTLADNPDVSDDNSGYNMTLNASKINVGGGVRADGSDVTLTLVASDTTSEAFQVAGSAIAANGAKMVIDAKTAYLGSLGDMAVDADGNTVGDAGSIDTYGTSVFVTGTDGVNISGGIHFGGTDSAIGLNIKGGNEFALTTTNSAADIDVAGGVSVGADNTLTLTSQQNVTIGGVVESAGTLTVNANKGDAVFTGDINNAKSFTVMANDISTADITNLSTMTLTATQGDITTGKITNSGTTATLTANNITGKISATVVENTANQLNMLAHSIELGSVDVSGGAVDLTAVDNVAITGNMSVSTGLSRLISKIDAPELTIGGDLTLSNGSGLTISASDIDIAGDIELELSDDKYTSLIQGSKWGDTANGLSLIAPEFTFKARSLSSADMFSAHDGVGTYEFKGDVSMGRTVIYGPATVDMTANKITMGDVTNNGTLSLTATAPSSTGTDVVMSLGTVMNNDTLVLNSGTGIVSVKQFLNDYTGTTELKGRGLTSELRFQSDGILRQGTSATASAGDTAILSKNYTISVGNWDKFVSNGIAQESGNHLTINASDIEIFADKTHNNRGDVNGSDITFVATKSNDGIAKWISAEIAGSVSGGTSFIGLGNLSVGGDYIFSDTSRINAAIQNTSNYWADVTMTEGEDFGKIDNRDENATALITVGGQFISTQGMHGDGIVGGQLPDASVGIVLRDMVNQGTAIWLLHSEYDGEKPLYEQGDKLRNVNVMFCNADGTKCFNYYKEYDPSMPNLPVYLSVRDTNEDGKNDSLYIVFDPRFGGPVSVFKVQPVVGETNPHTDGEYVSAGALDDVIVGKLHESGFYNRTPIEAIPLIFRDTNMSDLMNELYKRMERYLVDRDGTALARFSRLVTPREVENLMGAISLNEHTNFRDLEDRMMNEFIWNRNRRLKNAWVDVDFGIFAQDTSDDKTVDGNRFSIAGGFDWQHDRTTIFGLTARVSHMSMDNPDSFDLGYLPGESIAGHVGVTVDDTNIGIGGYMIKTLNPKIRLYGNLFADMHMLNVSRDMNYMSKIEGDDNAFAITTEWGLMHDWLNQYIVGNLYARAGYNTGFKITEQSDGADYMELKSDGYVSLAPGYTLTAQKRIYPSAWVQIRPYISAGVEYDVLGMPDKAQYKFAFAENYTDYRVDIDPLWANFGGGIDVLSVRGYQVGLDYRYQYNTDIRMHNIKISGSYRF